MLISSNNPSSIDHQQSSSYIQFSDPFLDDELFLNHLLCHQDLLPNNNTPPSPPQSQNTNHENNTNVIVPIIPNKGTDNSKKMIKEKGNSRKRNGKKDRHSKICTASGPRDRRMRLSLQIARKFFDLQDMLGFDKASNTIEWLFIKSKSAIKELKSNFSHLSHYSSTLLPSDNDIVLSNISKNHHHHHQQQHQQLQKMSRKLHVVTRESRDKARARARERTNMKKLMMKIVGEIEEPSNQFLKNQTDCVNVSDGATVSSLIRNCSHNVVVTKEGNYEDGFPGSPLHWDINNSLMHIAYCCTMTNAKSAPGQEVVGLDEIDAMIFQAGCNKRSINK